MRELSPIGMSMFRIKNRQISRMTHAFPEKGTLAWLGQDNIIALIHGLQRMIIFNPYIHAVKSNMEDPCIVTDGCFAAVVVRIGEHIRFRLQRGESVGRNGVQSVLVM